MVAEAKSLLERDLTFVIELFSKHLHLEKFEDEGLCGIQTCPDRGWRPKSVVHAVLRQTESQASALEVVFVVRARYFTLSRM